MGELGPPTSQGPTATTKGLVEGRGIRLGGKNCRWYSGQCDLREGLIGEGAHSVLLQNLIVGGGGERGWSERHQLVVAEGPA